MEEKLALAYAQAELKKAEHRAAASAEALAAVYGPRVAGGSSNPVVELSVRGMSVTTLRSALQACSDSAFAAWFDERWPENGKDVDGQGRHVVNCDPTHFSKILDILRMRKRASWAGPGEKGRKCTVLVAVVDDEQEPFEEIVDMYFPGCKNFTLDFVTISKATHASTLP